MYPKPPSREAAWSPAKRAGLTRENEMSAFAGVLGVLLIGACLWIAAPWWTAVVEGLTF